MTLQLNTSKNCSNPRLNWCSLKWPVNVGIQQQLLCTNNSCCFTNDMVNTRTNNSNIRLNFENLFFVRPYSTGEHKQPGKTRGNRIRCNYEHVSVILLIIQSYTHNYIFITYMVKLATCFDISVPPLGHYVRFVLFSIVIKPIYFYTLRRIWLKH